MGDMRTTNWREEEFYRPMYEGEERGPSWRDKLYIGDNTQEPNIVPVKREEYIVPVKRASHASSRGDRENTIGGGANTSPTKPSRNKQSLGARMFRREEEEEELGGRDRHLAGFSKAKAQPTATNRAYKAYTQHETRDKAWPSRSSSRMSYDTTGPLDERYYIRDPSDKHRLSSTTTDGVGDKQKESVFMRLLHNEILNYDTRELSNGHRKLSTGHKKLSNADNRKLSNAADGDQKLSAGDYRSGDYRSGTTSRKLSNADKFMSHQDSNKTEKPSLKHPRKSSDNSKHSNSSGSGNCSPSHAKIAAKPYNVYNNNNNNNKVVNRNFNNNNNKVVGSYVYPDSQGLNSPGYINMSKSTSALLQPSIPHPDYDDPSSHTDENQDRMSRLVNSLQRAHNRKDKDGDVWFNANRYRGIGEIMARPGGQHGQEGGHGQGQGVLKRSSSVDSHRSSSKMSSPRENMRKSPPSGISPLRESFSRETRSPVREERASRSPMKDSPSLPPVLESPLARRGGILAESPLARRGVGEMQSSLTRRGELESNIMKKAVIPTKTLKVALKNRPPVSAFIQEIMKASEADRERQRDRLNMELEAIDTVEEMEKQKEEDEKEEKKDSIDDDAQKIYKEILDVVKQNSPSLQSAQGRMVGYGGDRKAGGKQNKLSQKGIHPSNGHNMARIRLSEDRDSITTSLDSYPFSPSSPWGHAFPSRYNRFGYPVFPQRHFGLPAAGPVSFAGFSPSPSNLTSSSAGPASFQSELARKKKKKKKSWFSFF